MKFGKEFIKLNNSQILTPYLLMPLKSFLLCEFYEIKSLFFWFFFLKKILFLF